MYPSRNAISSGQAMRRPLPLLENLYEVARLNERRVGAGVEPGEPASKYLDEYVVALEIGAIDVSDLKFAAPYGVISAAISTTSLS